eukprot:1629238-Prymnesium_polylepis.2
MNSARPQAACQRRTASLWDCSDRAAAHWPDLTVTRWRGLRERHSERHPASLCSLCYPDEDERPVVPVDCLCQWRAPHPWG